MMAMAMAMALLLLQFLAQKFARLTQFMAPVDIFLS